MNKNLFRLLLVFILIHPHVVIGQICFEDSQFIPVDAIPLFIQAGDLDNDSFPDLVAASFDINDVIAVFMNNGDRTFGNPVYYYPSGTPVQINIADMNNDNIPDMVVSLRYYGFDIFYGQGHGNFDPPLFFYTGAWTSSIVIADFDDNSVFDIASSCQYDDSLRIYLADGIGGYEFAGSYFSGGHTPFVVHKGDFNHDSFVDLAVMNSGDNFSVGRSVTIYLGLDSGKFAGPEIYSMYVVPQTIDVADFNMDMNDDIVVGTDVTMAKIMFGIGDGTFNYSGFQDTMGLSSKKIVSADINMDGIPDMVSPGGYTSIALGHGDGTFSTYVNVVSYYSYYFSFCASVADFDRDGKNDFATVNQNAYEFNQAGNVAILYNCFPVGVEKPVNMNRFMVFPNPVSDEIMLETPGNFLFDHIRISNSFQQVVYDIRSDANRIDVKDLPPGVYFIQLLSGSALAGQTRFIKM